MITAPPNGKKSIMLAGNANDAWDDAAIEAAVAAIETAPERSVFVFDFEVPARVAERTLRAVANRGFRSVLDASFADRVNFEALDGLHAITPNVKEAGLLTGIDTSDEEAARHAAEALARTVPVVWSSSATAGASCAREAARPSSPLRQQRSSMPRGRATLSPAPSPSAFSKVKLLLSPPALG